MPKVYKRTLGSRVYQNYSAERLSMCLNDIRQQNMTQREAAKAYNIPRRTICYKLKEQHSLPVGRFRKFGIFPCGVEELLNRLPSASNSHSSIDESFIQHLNAKRSETTQNSHKRRKIKVAAGSSYAHEENSNEELSNDEIIENVQSKDKPINQASTSVSVQHLSDVEDCPVSNNGKYNVDNFVIFTYLNNLYPGLKTKTTSNGAIILSMEKSKKYYRWPDKEDRLFYKWSDIMMKINPPILIRRGYFQIPELDEYTE